MRKKRQITSYGRVVLARLEAKGMTVWELAQEVERRSGRFCTEKFIYNYVRGTPTPWPQDNAIRDILGLKRKEEMYGKGKRVLPGQPGDPQHPVSRS
jgi:hypothetical protein